MNISPIYNKRFHISSFIKMKNQQSKNFDRTEDSAKKQDQCPQSKLKQSSIKKHAQDQKNLRFKSKQIQSISKWQILQNSHLTINQDQQNSRKQSKLKKSKKQAHNLYKMEKQMEKQLMAKAQNDSSVRNSTIQSSRKKLRYKTTFQNYDLNQNRFKSISSSLNFSRSQSPTRGLINLRNKKQIKLSSPKKHNNSVDPYQYSTQKRQEKEVKRSKKKLIQVFNLYPKKSNDIRHGRKITAMNKYMFDSQNIRLAQKLLSIKPTRPCDKKEQFRFFKKQQYFKELRSYTIDFANKESKLKLVSQSVVTLPKIHQRYKTIDY